MRIGSTEEIYDESGNNQTVHDVSNVAFQNPNGQLVVQVNKMKLCDFLQVILVPKFGKVFYLLITSFQTCQELNFRNRDGVSVLCHVPASLKRCY